MAACFKDKELQVQGSNTKVKLQLWDTAGNERFGPLNRLYYRDCTAALIVYDITNKSTLLQQADHWIRDVKE